MNGSGFLIDFTLVRAVNRIRREFKSRTLKRNRCDGNAVGPLIDTVERAFQRAVSSFCNMQYEAQFRSTCAERSLPVTYDVLREA